MKYKEFTLDDFQVQAIQAIQKNHSVVVSAATGTGKTLIADYVIQKAINEDKRVVYTAPIKALSNQKYRDFKAEYGDKIGMLTGDIVINPGAQILIMTTEIYRNMLLEQSPDITDISYVVFDEIHFINDIERGTVWEESIIFSPNSIRFLCLSATIPNYRQFADWIQYIKEHTVETVNYMKRAVPLNHQFYDIQLGIDTIENIQRDIGPQKKRQRFSKKRSAIPLPSHTRLIKELELNEKLPVIFFSFSRMLCEKRAKELAKKNDFPTPEQKKEIVDVLHKTIPTNIKHMQSTRDIKYLVQRGIGVHHAGLFPKLKEVVETLFNKGILKVLYATETFAVGINMPAKTVCFGSLEKYDGVSFRLVNSKEYFQLAGRAGRRGIDTVGYAVSLIDRNRPELLPKIKQVTQKDAEPIISQYNLSYNTVLNLIKRHDDEQIQTILQSNFGYFVKKQSQDQVRIMQSFRNYCKILERLGFLENQQLTWKGEFATRIYTKELEIGELVFSKLLEDMNLSQMCIVLASLIYEGRRQDSFDTNSIDIGPILKKLQKNTYVIRKIKKSSIKRMYAIVHPWIQQKNFEEVLQKCSLAEGDIIRLFRQLIDILRQIKGSLKYQDPTNPLIEKVNEALQKIDRDVVKIDL